MNIPSTQATPKFPTARWLRTLLRTAVLAIVIAIASTVTAFAQDDDAAIAGSLTAVFGTSQPEHASSNEAAAKWNALIDRVDAQRVDIETGIAAPDIQRGSDQWQRLIDMLQDEEKEAQVETVNRFFNGLTYQSDYGLYVLVDYWATPYEFLALGRGDCEDFAAAKYFTLRSLGFSTDELRLVVGQDARTNLFHVIVLVAVGEEIFALDNNTIETNPLTAATSFKPFYSVNENDLWLHPAAYLWLHLAA